MQEDLLNMEPKKDLKKPLIYGAIGFLVFIVIVIAIALYQNSKSKEENINEIIPPETTQKVDTEFKPIAVEEPKIDTKKLAEAAEPKKEEKPQEQPVKEPKKEEAKAVKETKKPIEVEKKTVVEKKPANSQPKPVEKKTQKLSGNYYIQVAALLRNAKPNPKFLALIKKAGFNYTIYKTCFKKNGEKIKVTKVLIGPFKSRKEALEAMKKVKANITQNAFIFRVKK